MPKDNVITSSLLLLGEDNHWIVISGFEDANTYSSIGTRSKSLKQHRLEHHLTQHNLAIHHQWFRELEKSNHVAEQHEKDVKVNAPTN